MADQPDRNNGRERAALVPLLLAMTVVTGGVDAVSILRLGHVFVANMTGNVVFLGFALAGSSGFSVSASLVALGAFMAGAALGGRVVAGHPGLLLGRAAASEAVLCAAAAIVAAAVNGVTARYTMIVLLGVAMGGQNATARKLSIPDMTTTVLTMTLTGLAADPPDRLAPDSRTLRRLGAVAAMLIGAALGTLLVWHASSTWALGADAALLAAVAAASRSGAIRREDM
jgi:uncharacterized membrane protein YoaK (UPF0700 family)